VGPEKPSEYVEPISSMTPGLDAAIQGLTNPAPTVPKVEEPKGGPILIVGDQAGLIPQEKIPETHFQIGVEAPDREYLKLEAIFLLPPEMGKRQYLVMQFSDAPGKRFECQFLLPEGGSYEEGIKKAFRRLAPVNPFPRREAS
jgi:hypothetical protein